MTLYEIEQSILDCVDMETGEILDTQKLDELNMARESKIESVALWFKDLIAESKAIGDEISNLQARKASAERKAASLKDWIAYALQGDKFKTPKVNCSYRKSSFVNIDADADIPDNYMRYSEPQPDKTALKDALQSGVNIDGVTIGERISMIIK